ncbi:hypothetical protein Pan153_52300 [Gimesia panareensis]|uniref:Uncharacterized protein n=1 Tax=Gimesia panareensis TaxID=2527978 RepID=A0A518FW37_9PLAN|nr:hypothetical protein Pan153_52300 [Gimesia panareensis]
MKSLIINLARVSTWKKSVPNEETPFLGLDHSGFGSPDACRFDEVQMDSVKLPYQRLDCLKTTFADVLGNDFFQA